jgi:hypothetical protein
MSDLTIETIKRDGFEIEISYDEMGGDSREWDNLGTIASNLSDYSVGSSDLELCGSYDNSWIELQVLLIENNLTNKYYENDIDDGYIPYANMMDDFIVFGYSAHIHSGVALGSVYLIDGPEKQSYGWDSGFAGYIFASKEKIRNEFGIKHITNKVIKAVQEHFQNEIKCYNQDIEGEIYCYSVFNSDGDVIDSCSGFYKENEALESANEHIDFILKERLKNKSNRLKQLIVNKVPLLARGEILNSIKEGVL